MQHLLWAECRKLRRSHIIWVSVFAVVMTAVIVFAAGQEVYYGSQEVYYGSRFVDHPGWYMNVAQTLAAFFVLPAVTALLGSYMICREEQEDTLKSLQLIPIDEAKLNAAKMAVSFVLCVLLYLLLFVITYSTEAVLHFSELPRRMVLGFLKEYFLDGIGTFFAISPIIALVSRMKKGYWLALVLAEIYSFTGLLANMSRVLSIFYPVTAVFNLSGHYTADAGQMTGSILSLLLCGCLSLFLLKGLKRRGKM